MSNKFPLPHPAAQTRPFTALLLLWLLFTVGCAGVPPAPAAETVLLTDAAMRPVTVPYQPHTVAALGASLAELWLEAGGSLAGVTSDAFEGRTLALPDTITVVGTIKDPDADLLLALQPDLVILSPDLAGHTRLAPIFDQAGIAYFYATADSFPDYLTVLEAFTRLTGAAENYQLHGTAQQETIQQLLESCTPRITDPRALVLRAFSSGVRVKADGIVATEILDDFAVANIAASRSSLLEELSLEAIVEEDPDYIFVVTMGDDTAAAMQALEASLTTHPAWQTLSAVQSGQLHFLPKDLFHYKPNARWMESYQYLHEIICQP
ncbi:MAG: ABC transporter substrate-binding protein [Anaerolineae bacterium]|jgi:iron complex transport system substrate-binding protein|nr:ABC transporter substrate-binding protein [Anaerolineae bacterium]